MKIPNVLVFLVAVAAGCSKQSNEPAAGSAESPAAPAPAPAPKPTAAAAAKAPNVTPEMLFSDQPVWEFQLLDRGLYTRVGKAPVEHKCRVEAATIVAKMTVARLDAKKLAAEHPTTCGPKAGYQVCTFKHPTWDFATRPEAHTNWVFTGSDEKPILVAVLFGEQEDFDAVAPQFNEIKPCPRPSQDPEYK